MRAFDVCLSHDSAFRWLMRNERVTCTKQVTGNDLALLAPLSGETAALLARDLGLGPYCIDLLAGAHEQCCPGVLVHRIAPSATLSYWEVPVSGYGRVCVASPEETFVQLAQTHSLLETVYMGFALCANYRIEARAAHGMVMRDASCGTLTSREKILSFVNAHPHMKGSGKARRALAYVRNGSNSPLESALAMGLGMPVVFGGFNVGHVAMSRRNRHRVAHSLTAGNPSAEDDAVLVIRGRGLRARGSASGASQPFLLHVMGTKKAKRMPQTSRAVSLSEILDYESYRQLCMDVRKVFVKSASRGLAGCSSHPGANRKQATYDDRQRKLWRLIVCMSDFRNAEFGISSPLRTLPAA